MSSSNSYRPVQGSGKVGCPGPVVARMWQDNEAWVQAVAWLCKGADGRMNMFKSTSARTVQK